MEHQFIYYKTLDIRRLIPVLDKYFGLGIGYFSVDLQFLLQKEFLSQEEEDKEWEFIHFVQPDEFKMKWIECFGNIYIEPIYMEALYFFANIIHSEVYYAREESICDGVHQDDIMYWECVRKDLLKLYIFVNDPEIKKTQSLVVQHLTGKLELENHDGWFINRMSADYLSKYLSDITSIEQARKELQSYNKVAGQKVRDKREPVIMCGLYYLIHDTLQLKSKIPNNLCEFIYWFLDAVDCPTSDEYDNLKFRSRLRHFLPREQLYRFNFPEIGHTIGASKETGKRMY